MTNNELTSFKEMMTSYVSLFLEKVRTSRDMMTSFQFDRGVNPYNNNAHLGFQLFYPHDKALYAQRYSFDSLEQLIRKYLVLSPFLDSLNSRGKECKTALQIEFHEFAGITNARNEEINFIELTINDSNHKYGIRFSPYTSRIKNDTLDSLGIDCVLAIDWRTTYSKIEKHESLSFYRELCNDITIKDFFALFLSIEEFEIYLTMVKEAVAEATEIMGFHTIEAYTNRYKHNLRKQVVNELINFSFNESNYQPLKLEDKTISPSPFTIGEIEYLQSVFNNSRLYYSLIGTEDFAKCFLTSEYLYHIISDNYSFDFTPVVTGYLKSIELLLYYLMKQTLIFSDATLFITANIIPEGTPAEDIKTRKNKKGKTYRLIRFEEKYEEYFNTTIGSLTYFLFDNKDAWPNLSTESRNYIKYLLSRYGQECRNEHFHLDIVNDLSEVTSIRSNTIFLFFLILSSYQFTDIANTHNLYESSCISFEKLYDKMHRIHQKANRFIFEFEDKTVNCLRCTNQPVLQYDEYGSTKELCINFHVVDSFSDIQSSDKAGIEIFEKATLVLNKNNMPKRIWIAKKDGSKGKEILWDVNPWL